MRTVVFDIETEAIPPDGKDKINTIWCIVTKELETQEVKVWTAPFFGFNEYAAGVDLWVAHNGLAFDVPVVNRILGSGIDESAVVDTFVVSRLVNYSGFNGHGLDELGLALGFKKFKFNDWSQLSQEMIDYCIRDVEVTEKVYNFYKKYIWAPEWKEAMRLEHDMVLINEDMTRNGFFFNYPKGEEILANVKARMAVLEAEMQEAWPPELKEVNRIQYRLTKDGEEYKNVKEFWTKYPKVELEGAELVAYDYESFNPGSTKQRVEKLWDAGWKPFDKSKTHQEFSRIRAGEKWRNSTLTAKLYKEKKEYFDYYGWKVNEDNLATLPDTAPQAAKSLAEWLTLEGRRSSLEEWLGQVREDGKIHGKFWFIGSWTHRMSHSEPNQANIVSPFHGEPTNAVQQVKAEFDADMRALWMASPGATLVGTDADGIQLRILAHYLKNDDYVHSIVSGRKEDETDIHNLNRRALGLDHLIRDDAKTFIYAWLLGAGLGKVGSILRCNQTTAKQAVANFMDSTEGLRELKRGQIVRDAKRGYFIGVDGRRVACRSEHLMLAGYLQNAEAIIMKRANRLWRQWADAERINYKQVDFVHDEWQTECYGSQDMCERLGELQRNAIEQTGKDLNLYCPLAGSTDFGYNWKETH